MENERTLSEAYLVLDIMFELMTKNSGLRSNGLAVLAIGFAVLLLPLALAVQTNAQLEDPHTVVSGTLETSWQIIDGFVHVKDKFTSDDLNKKYGYSQMEREEIYSVDNYDGPSSGTATQTNVTFRMIAESESAKLDAHQKIKNKGFPMRIYTKWEAIIPDQPNPTQDIGLKPLTHVVKFASKNQGPGNYVEYDPIDVIWQDQTTINDSLLTEALEWMDTHSWSTSTCAGSDNLYVYISARGGWIAQDAHRYISLGGCSQYHVRMWKMTSTNDNLVIGAAHVEDAHYGALFNLHHIRVTDGTNWWEYNVPIWHGPHDFESGETRVRTTFSGCWSPSANSHYMANEYKREQWNPVDGSLHVTAYSSAYATVISRTCAT